MKVGIISDLHLNKFTNLDVFLSAFIESINENKLDFVLLAGDIYEDAYGLIDMVAHIELSSTAKIYYICGNHDLWNDRNMSTNDVLAVYADDEHCIMGKDVRLGDYMLVADMGWYDFSLADNEFSRDELFAGRYMGRHWKDSSHIDFGMSYESYCDMINDNLEARLDKYADYDVILMTHFALDDRLLGDASEDEMWKFYNGYLGSVRGLELAKRANIKIAISGHSHMRADYIKDGTRYISACYEDTKSKNRRDKSAIKADIRAAMKLIEL